MTSKNEISPLLVALDECVSRYIDERRRRLPGFIKNHFSLQETWQLQKRSLTEDMILFPLNALWVIPYVTFRKSVETLDKLGWKKLTPVIEWLPSGIRTQQQRAVEELIAAELLEWPRAGIEGNGLWKEILAHPVTASYVNAGMLKAEWVQALSVRTELGKFSSSRALVSDLAVSFGALFVGWKFFGDGSLGLGGLGDRLARKMARDKAASDFFLGKSFGSAFYDVFPPEPTRKDVVIATLLVGALMTVISLAASVFGDPLRKRLGLQEGNLVTLIDGVEGVVALQLRRRVRKELAVD